MHTLQTITENLPQIHRTLTYIADAYPTHTHAHTESHAHADAHTHTHRVTAIDLHMQRLF